MMIKRPISSDERSILEAQLSEIRGRKAQYLEGLIWPVVMFAAVLVGLWALATKLVRWLFDVDIGYLSHYAPWILAFEILLVAWLIGHEVVKVSRRSGTAYRNLKADLSSGMAEELELNVVDAQRFQEPEHGGFIYFLLTTDGSVYVQFDYESQDLGVNESDPASSHYVPCETLKVARAPNSGHILSSQFSGAPIAVSATRVLTAKPAKWPESDTFSKISWNDLASSYAA